MRGQSLAGLNLLDLAPRRSAEWIEKGDRVVVERPRPSTLGLRSLGARLSFFLAAKCIRLDERGSFIWRRLDGERTVGEIAQALREEFGEAVEPAEERAGRLVRMLHREGLVVYPGWDEAAVGDARM